MAAIKYYSSVTLLTDPILTNKVLANPAGTNASPLIIAPTVDGIRVTNDTNPATTITLSGFSSAHFTNTNNVYLTPGQSQNIYAKSTATLSTGTFTASASLAGYTPKTFYYSVLSSADTTPDPFTLGSDVSNAVATDWYYANLVTVSGVNQNVVASLSSTGTGTAEFSVNGSSSWVTSNGLINNGDTIQVRIIASAGNGATTSTDLTIGTVSSGWWSVTTKVNPFPSTEVLSPYGLPLSLLDTCFFLGNMSDNLAPLYKGGSFVPNIVANSSVSTNSGAVSLAALANVTTEISFQKARAKFFFYDNVTGGNATITWRTGTNYNGAVDPDIVYGFHPDLAHSMEFYAVLTETEGTGVVLSGSGNVGVWASNNFNFTVSVTAPTNSTQNWRGYITVYARHRSNTTPVISTQLTYRINSTTGVPSNPGGDYNVP